MRKLLASLVLLLLSLVIIAQTEDCPAIVETALNAIDTLCEDAGRNQACYGNVAIETVFQSDVMDITFADVGDIVDMGAIQSMQLSPMDEDENKWGLALLRLQANIPDTVPGQNVTFLLFGDVEITDASEDFADTDLNPMQAFYLKTGIGDAGCEQAPESGLLVQTPDGVSEVAFNINGVDVAMGSTILFQAQPDEEMTISALEGSAMMELEGDIHTAIAGTELRVPIDRNFRPTGPPPPPEAYRQDTLRRIPSQRLERPIMPPPPLADEKVALAHEMIRNGQPPCGMEGFPDCDRLPTGGLREGPACQNGFDACVERLAPHQGFGILPPEDNRQCILRPREGNATLPANETRPFCDNEQSQGGNPPNNTNVENTPPPQRQEQLPENNSQEGNQQQNEQRLPENNSRSNNQPSDRKPPGR